MRRQCGAVVTRSSDPRKFCANDEQEFHSCITSLQGGQAAECNHKKDQMKGKKKLPGDETAAQLRSILQVLDSQASAKPVNTRNQQRRVDEIRSRITKLVNKEAKKLCCCRLSTAVLTSKQFEADTARPCVVHGRRNLGHLVVLGCTTPVEDDFRIKELVRQYHQEHERATQG